MSGIRSKVNEIYSLEQLSIKNTIIHNIHPLIKMIVTVVYIVCILSVRRYDLLRFSYFLFYLIITTALAELPLKIIIKRTMIALPFVLFAGISNLIINRETAFFIGRIAITYGLISFAVLIIRTMFSVWALLILIATTRFSDLTKQLIRLHIPPLIVNLMEMIYRYIGVLAEEVSTMLVSYRLKNPSYKWPHIKHMGPFVGNLFLKSINKAERIYNAMKCRGYGSKQVAYQKEKIALKDIVFFLLCTVSSVIFVIL